MQKIAIIDDDTDIVEATTIILQSANYEVVSASNVDDAIRLVTDEKPDLVILDVMLDEPDDGFYLANKFRKSGFDMPIIMLTSIAKVTGYDYGLSDMLPIEEFIEKPVQPSVLLDKTAELLKKGGK